MQKCEDCKLILDNDVRHCPKCGKDIASDTAPAPTPEPILDVPKLLAAANLHKFRSEWDEALSAATDALRLEPRNAEIAQTLGSIYEERGMLEEALVWYQMTLELDEDSKQGKAGHDRVGMLMSARRKEAAAAPLKDPAQRATLYAYGIGGAVLLVIVGLLISLAMRGGGHSRSQAADRSANHSLTPPISQPWARGARPSPMPSTTSASKSSEPSLSGETTAAPTQSTGGLLRTKAEQTIRQGLAAAQPVTQAGATIDDVIADPRAAVATVTFSISLKGMVTKDQITRAAVAIAKKTFELHQAVHYVTTRCVIQTPGADGGQVAFVGDIAREAVTPTATDQQLAAAFNHPWWNPQIK
jgi:hypothetical protein